MGNFFVDKIKTDKRYNSADRVAALDLLEPVTRKKVRQIISDGAAHGLKLMVYETFRSRARQKLLFEQGATKLRSVGVHHYGLACDIVKDIGGDPSWKGDFSLIGQLAKANGMIWGGDWGTPSIKHSFVDNVHVQRITVARQAALFSGQWYPDNNYEPISDG